MSDAEFDEQASAIAERIGDADFEDRVAAACRGSGNPAALAWLGEALRLGPGTSVVDLGAGLGGPAAWLGHRFRCDVVAVEPATGAVASARSLFDLACVQSSAAAAPFRDSAFDVVLLLGVVSVVDDARAVVREARRLGRRLGVLEYCAVGSTAIEAGGSRFPTPEELSSQLRAAGWHVDDTADLTIPPPRPWTEAAESASGDADATVEAVESEREVVAAIDRGEIAPRVLSAS